MVMNYLGRSLPYDQLMAVLGVTPDLGAPASNVKRLSRLGLRVEYSTGQIDRLIEYLGQSTPCIVFLDTVHLSYWAETARHAAVVVGIDEQRVHLNDPFFAEAPQSVSRLEFELAWDETDNTYAIITAGSDQVDA